MNERLDKHEQLLIKMAELLTAIAKARKQTNPAYPFHPTMRLGAGVKLMNEISELASELAVPEPEVEDGFDDEPSGLIPGYEPRLVDESGLYEGTADPGVIEVPDTPDENDTTLTPDDD